MSTTGVDGSCVRNSATIASTSRSDTPLRSARSDERWITGPSAIGSEKGTPSSITSAPPAASACMNSTVRAGSGSPAVMNGISPFRPSADNAANVFLIRDMECSRNCGYCALGAHRSLHFGLPLRLGFDAARSRRRSCGADALARYRTVAFIDLIADEFTLLTGASDGGRAAAHERVEHAAALRTTGQHHPLDDLQRFLGGVRNTFGMLPMQPRNRPDVLWIVAKLQPLAAFEQLARTRLLRDGVIRDADGIEIEEIVLRHREKTDVVVHRGKAAHGATHAGDAPVPDDFVDHREFGLQEAEDFRRILPGAENVQRTRRLEFRNSQLQPAARPGENILACAHVRVVTVILAQPIGRITYD